ncbi:hypothetical protein DY000_02016186 [Brassica cretica]|uniref:Uncharacterized protein n=1 Tax=Brassica cretica TaxID=69181 RepID=A0ABQ7DB76_BRACR|nr:hypothetical protein DY000_02016186 [Brassica cretica]
MILAPRPGRSVIDGIPNRDDQWREKFFVFKINPASVGDFDFETIPRVWSDDIEPFGSAPMTPELRGLIATFRRGSPRWLAFPGRGRRRRYPTVLTSLPKSGRGSELRKQRGPTLRSRSQTQSPGLLARPVLIVIPVGGARRAPNASTGSVGDRALDDDIDSSTHRRRRRALKEINSVNSNSRARSFLPRYELLAKVPILENPEGLALIWRNIREKGYELPPLDDMHESDAYVRMAVATAKAMEASNKYTALMEKRLADFPSKEEVGSHLLTIQQLRGESETVRVTGKQRKVEIEGLNGKLVATEAEKVALQTDLDLMKEKHMREIEGCKATALMERSLARRSIAQKYDAVLAVYSEGGFELEEELGRLKDREISLDLDYGFASVSGPSLSRLDLPEVSGDSVDQE